LIFYRGDIIGHMQTDNLIFTDYLTKFITNLQAKSKSQYTITAYKKDVEQFLGFLPKNR
jgi:site-specific recombinase XerD